jgi:hypothetical protein
VNVDVLQRPAAAAARQLNPRRSPSPPRGAAAAAPGYDEEEAMIDRAIRLSLLGKQAADALPEPALLGLIEGWRQRRFEVVQGGSGGMIDIGYDHVPGRTDQYRYNFPKTPMLHTYNPYKGAEPRDDHMWQGILHVPHVSINLKAPENLFRGRLPKTVRAAVSAIPSESLDIFWVVQNNPWTKTARVLFRPHYWLDPDAPFESQAPYVKAVRATVRILSSIPEGITFNDPNMDVSTHGESANGTGHIISSPDNAHIPEASRPDGTFSFWSLTQANGRTAITLHWILNDQDNDLILESIQRSERKASNLEQLLNILHQIIPYRGSELLKSRLLPELDEFLDFRPQR